jgi:hypothetical protein
VCVTVAQHSLVRSQAEGLQHAIHPLILGYCCEHRVLTLYCTASTTSSVQTFELDGASWNEAIAYDCAAQGAAGQVTRMRHVRRMHAAQPCPQVALIRSSTLDAFVKNPRSNDCGDSPHSDQPCQTETPCESGSCQARVSTAMSSLQIYRCIWETTQQCVQGLTLALMRFMAFPIITGT